MAERREADTYGVPGHSKRIWGSGVRVTPSAEQRDRHRKALLTMLLAGRVRYVSQEWRGG